MNHAMQTPPTDAFRFAARVQFSAPTAGTNEPRKISGVAYSGDVLAHPFWGSVVFDLSTTTAPEKLPVLVEHDRARRAGVAKLSITPDRITIASGNLLPNATGAEVAADADAGFPWQLSVHIEPAEVQQLATGETARVNGRTVSGPAAVFRRSLIREVSFTPTGVDHNTNAAVFSTAAQRRSAKPAQEIAKVRAERDAVVAELAAERVAAVQRDPHKFAAAIRAEQAKAEQSGRAISVIEAANRVRDAASRGNWRRVAP